MKKFVSIILVAAMLMSMGAALAVDSGEKRAVIGADLSADQKAAVYNTFGIEQGSVTELTVTNSEERQYLEGLVDSSVIGSRSISCVYIETLDAGQGLQVDVSNISWCTREMYINALVTAGISDAKLIVTSPISGISGTAALTGIYKAYEDITGQALSDDAKIVGTQELVITAEIADTVGSYDAVTIVNELKKILGQTVNMTDEEVKAEIRNIAKQMNINVSDAIVDQLLKLCRSLEGLNSEELQKKVEEAQSTIKKLADAQEKASGIIESVKGFFKSVGDFFSKIFGGKKD